MEVFPKRITIKISASRNFSRETHFTSAFLPFDLIRKLIDELSKKFSSIKKRPMTLMLKGGELFLHPDIFNILSYAKTKNIGLTIFINRMLIGPDFAKKIVEKKPEALMFSIDGPQRIHDQIHGSGNFEKTYAAIKMIQYQKRMACSRKPRILINTPINNLNINYLDEILAVCDKLRINGLSFSHIQWPNQKLSKLALKEIKKRLGREEPPSRMIESMKHNLYVKTENLKNLLDKVSFIKNHHQNKHYFNIRFIPDLSPEEIKLWYLDDSYKINSCDSVREQIRIGVNGDVYPICAPIPFFPWGNLKNQSLKKILNSKKTKEFFDEIESNGLFYACQRCCRRNPESKCIQKKSLSFLSVKTRAS